MAKKLTAFLLFLVMLLSCVSITFASGNITLVVNGAVVGGDVNPVIINGRTMVPVRSLFDRLGATVSWNADLNQAIVSSPEKVIIFTIGSNLAYINGNVNTTDAAPVIMQGRTLIPVRFVSENLGYSVVWNEQNRTVYINGTSEGNASSNNMNQYNSQPENNPPATGTAKLSSITATDGGDSCIITVKLSQKTQPKTMTLSSPNRIVFDFAGVEQVCADSKIKFDGSSVEEVRWATHSDYTRVVVQTTAPSGYDLSYSGSDCIINVSKTATAPEASSPNQPSASQPTEQPVVADKLTFNGSVPTVVVDAGHGGYDTGAIGRDENGNVVIYEKDVNFTIAQKLEQRLKARGINVIMTRTTDTDLADTIMAGLVARADVANSANADLFVSVHNNAFTSPDATGTSVLYAGLSNSGGYGISSETLAQNIQTPLVKATGLKDRGIVRSPEMVVLKRTIMPAVLVECAFVTSYTDQKVLLSQDKLNAIADAICEGVVTSLRTMGKIK